LKIIEKVQISKLGEIETIIKVKRQTAPFPTPTNTDATLGGGTESAETVQHDSLHTTNQTTGGK
jgi:hypothetical protein